MPNRSTEPSPRDMLSPQATDEPSPPDDFLPPVHPPGAGLIMQLFFIPMIIVTIIVTVWLMFSWLAHMGSRPDELVKDFEQLNEATWQKALTLANMLRDPSSSALRRDPRMAQRLASVLDRQIEVGQTDTGHVWFRMYLCRALGEFEVADGLPALLRAASEERAVEDLEVRRAALQAIGLLVDRVGASTAQENDDLLPALERAAAERGDQPDDRDARAKLRSTAAFVLGLLDGEAAGDQLVRLASDPYPFVRYNAAVGLARQGDERAVPRLVEMLDPHNVELLKSDESQTEVEWNRIHVMRNALRAAKQLAEKNAFADLSPLGSAVDELIKTKPRGGLGVEAGELSRILRQRQQLTTTQ